MGKSTACPGNIMLTILWPLNLQPNSSTQSWYSAATKNSWYWIHNISQKYYWTIHSTQIYFVRVNSGHLTHWSCNKIDTILQTFFRWHFQVSPCSFMMIADTNLKLSFGKKMFSSQSNFPFDYNWFAKALGWTSLNKYLPFYIIW